MNKQFIAIVVAVVIGLFGILYFTRDKAETGGEGANGAQATSHTVGAGNKNVTLVEYGDFQCPACKAFFPIIQQIKTDYGDDIKFQFSHFPLTSIHPNAFRASRAAEAAGNQGKFFEMHDLLYENQDSWASSSDPTEIFVGYANQLQLNADQFKTDLNSEAVANAINADLAAGRALGANATPTFVINGRKLDPTPRTLDEFKKIIDEEIAKSSSGQQN